MRPYQKKKKRFDKIIVNSLIAIALIILLSGPVQKLYFFLFDFINSATKVTTQATDFNLTQITNATKIIQTQAAQITDLKAGLKICSTELRESRLVANKAMALDELLKIKRVYFPDSITAQIITRSPSSWHQEVIINRGSALGVKLGMVVVTQKGILGQIQAVKPNYSVVQLMSSSQIRLGVVVRRVGTMGILFGSKGGYGRLKFIPIGSDVKKGDIIQTSGINIEGIERLFPLNYPLGQVIEVSNNNNNSELFIKVKLFEDGYSIDSGEVLVLKPQNRS